MLDRPDPFLQGNPVASAGGVQQRHTNVFGKAAPSPGGTEILQELVLVLGQAKKYNFVSTLS